MALIEANLHAFWDGFGVTGAERVEPADAIAWFSDHPFGLLNPVTRFRAPAPEAGAVIDRLLAGAERRGVDQWWWGGPGDPAGLGEQLEARGLQSEPAQPGMALALDDWSAPERPDGLEIVAVGPAEEDEYLRVLMAAFGFPPPLHEPIGRALLKLSEDPRIINVAARVDGETIGCGTLLLDEGIAGIWNVGTLEAARGRGAGTALTAAAMAEGAAHGAHHAVLIATPKGEPVYRSMGFETLCEMPMWVRAG